MDWAGVGWDEGSGELEFKEDSAEDSAMREISAKKIRLSTLKIRTLRNFLAPLGRPAFARQLRRPSGLGEGVYVLFYNESTDTQDVAGIVRRGYDDHPIAGVTLRNHGSPTPRSITSRSADL